MKCAKKKLQHHSSNLPLTFYFWEVFPDERMDGNSFGHHNTNLNHYTLLKLTFEFEFLAYYLSIT